MSYLSIVAWAAMVAIASVLILMLLKGVARNRGWHRFEGSLASTIIVLLFVLIVGTVVLLAVASWSYVYPL